MSIFDTLGEVIHSRTMSKGINSFFLFFPYYVQHSVFCDTTFVPITLCDMDIGCQKFLLQMQNAKRVNDVYLKCVFTLKR